ncbi:unnamed protein product, partial [Mesorhabditis spiculigera]
MHSVFTILLLLLFAVAITVVESRVRQVDMCDGQKCEWWQFCCATLQECERLKTLGRDPPFIMCTIFYTLLLLLFAVTVAESENLCAGAICSEYMNHLNAIRPYKSDQTVVAPYSKMALVYHLLLLLVVVPAVTLDWCLDDSQCPGVDGYCFINRCSVKVNGVATDRLCAGGRLECGDGEFCCKLPHVADGGYCAKVVDGGCPSQGQRCLVITMSCVGYILLLIFSIGAVTVEAFCLANGECPPGHDCVDLHCVKQERCHDRHDCPDFHVCLFNRCVLPRPRCGVVRCSQGEHCCHHPQHPEIAYCTPNGEICD